MVEDARVVVTELMSNVVRHAGTSAQVDVDLDAEHQRLRVDVLDHAGGDVVLGSGVDSSSALAGRGLRLVDQLSARWGVDRQPDGKCVWAEWDVGACPPHPTPRPVGGSPS